MDIKHKAKKEALKRLKQLMSGPDDMDGGITAKVIAKDPEDLKEGLKKAAEIVDKQEDYHDSEDYDSYSKEELIEKLKKYKGM